MEKSYDDLRLSNDFCIEQNKFSHSYFSTFKLCLDNLIVGSEKVKKFKLGTFAIPNF